MIPQEFDYSAPQSLGEALALVASGERKILAGGMSLIPMMKLRLATPAEVVDLGRIAGLNAIGEAGGFVQIGAMATHHAVETSPVVRARCPLLSETASHIGDVQVRNMGTLGGSIAHADPAADYPAALVALEARIHLVAAHSDRTVEAGDFFLDAFTTALEPGELVLVVRVPVEQASEGYCYEKVAHPASGFAVVGVAVRVKREGAADRHGAHRRDGHGAARLPRACRGKAAGRRRLGGAGRGPGGRGRRGQFRPVCIRRLPPPPGPRSHPPGAGRGAFEGGMKIAGEYLMAVSQERTFALLQNPEVLARAMPGCESLEPVGENEYAMRMKMVLASMSGLFQGKVRIADSNPPASFRLIVEGQGKIGFMKGEGLLTLSAVDAPAGAAAGSPSGPGAA